MFNNWCDICFKELIENTTGYIGIWKYNEKYQGEILCEICVKNLKNCFVFKNRCFSREDKANVEIPCRIGMCLSCNVCQSILHSSDEYTFRDTIVPYLPMETKKKIFTIYLCEKIIRLRYLAEKNTVLKRYIFPKIILLLCENFEF